MTEEKGTVAIGISYSAAVLDKRNIVMQTHVPLTISDDEFNVVVRKLDSVCRKLEASYEVDRLKKDKDNLINTRKKVVDDIERLDFQNPSISGSSKSLVKLKDEQAKERVARDNALASLRRFDEEIARLDKEILIQEELANAALRPTDSDSSSSDC